MAEIFHLIPINCPADQVFKAVSEQKGVRGWWTNETNIDCRVGGIAEFTFGSRYYNKMIIRTLSPPTLLEWECLEADPEWLGTKIRFELESKGNKTILKFKHSHWKEATDFFATCNHHWGHYMTSIKEYCETGKGRPYSGD